MEEQTRKEEWQSKMDTRDAAVTLMEQYIQRNIKEFAISLGEITPFYTECSHEGLEMCMSYVNTTIATIALEVIEDWNEREADDPDRRRLPCGAFNLKQSVYYLTRFISGAARLSDLLSKGGVPAIDLCSDAFYEREAKG